MTTEGLPHRDAAEIANWLRARIGQLLNRGANEIETATTFDQFGLDSATAVSVSLDLEDWIGHPVDPAILYDYPTIALLADALAALGRQKSICE